VRLLLASSRPALPPEFAGAGSRVAVIVNAQDRAGRRARHHAADEEIEYLTNVGLVPAQLDLRSFDRGHAGLIAALETADLFWVAGGNAFVLRQAMLRSGFDLAVHHLERPLTYVGWSAGACVCGPTLRGLELVDEPPRGLEPIWDGLGLVDFAIVPHYQSDPPLGPEIDRVVAFWETKHTPYRALRDGETISISRQRLSASPGSRGGALR
jgi:dipeptidase E